MGDIIKDYDAEKVACDFYDWLVMHGYKDIEDELEDIEDVILDFEHIQTHAPMLFHLLMDISDH